MIYFKTYAKKIEKYNINFNEEKLSKLKEEIIDKCSIIEHKDYEGIKDFDIMDRTIKNFSAITTGKKDSEGKTIYNFSYDKYHFPYLAKIIDGIFCEYPSAIDGLVNIDSSKELKKIDEAIKFIYNKLDTISDEKEKIVWLNKLNRYLKIKDSSKNQKDIFPYYKLVKNELNFELMDTLSVSDPKRVTNFFLEKEQKSKSKKLKRN